MQSLLHCQFVRYFTDNKKFVVASCIFVPNYNIFPALRIRGNFNMSPLSDISFEFKVSGKAKCAPEDTFDLKLGRSLAYNKAKSLALSRYRAQLEKIRADYLMDEMKLENLCVRGCLESVQTDGNSHKLITNMEKKENK